MPPTALQAMGVGAVTDILFGPFVDDAYGARVERLDADQRSAVAVERIEPVAMSGTADGNDVTGVDAGLVDALADDGNGVAPELVEVAFDMAWLRHAGAAVAGGERSSRPDVSKMIALMTVLPASRPRMYVPIGSSRCRCFKPACTGRRLWHHPRRRG